MTAQAGRDAGRPAASQGYCHRCGAWPAIGRIVAVIESATGPGASVVEPVGGCPGEGERHPVSLPV